MQQCHIRDMGGTLRILKAFESPPQSVTGRVTPCSELAIRDGKVRELREERDAVMASVRQRNSALQVGGPASCFNQRHYCRETAGQRALVIERSP